MRAAVVVILATITGIAALLNFKSESVLNGFGAQASSTGAAEVVAVPQSQGGVAQGRVRPQVAPRTSRSGEQRSQLPAQRAEGQRLPKGCRVIINGEDVTVRSGDDQAFNLAVPENGTLTLRCEKDGVRSKRSDNEVPAPADGDQAAPGEEAPDQGVPGQEPPGQQGPGKPKDKPNQPPADQNPADPGADPQGDPVPPVGDGSGS